MTRYIGILEREPGTLWGIWFPDLPGCVTAAETAEQALDQAPEALWDWIEAARERGVHIPDTRPIETLRQDPDVADALAKGDVAILLPISPHDAAFAPELLDAIDAAAQARGLTRLDFVREAVLEKIAG
jgi:predicted RNase H-like HicB family nuclease